MAKRRAERVSHAIQREVSSLLQRGINDPAIGMATVTRVSMSDDLRYAKVWVSVYGGEEKRAAAMKALSRAAPFVRRELAGRIRLRFAPEVRFVLDESIEKVDRVLRLLREVSEERGKEAEGEQ